MKEILEIAMLVCFGFSWPLSLARNIKAHSAKGMSPSFIILIMTGYVCGIISKLIGGGSDVKFYFVLAVYILNLVIVSMNLVVYFINRRHDREAEKNGRNA